VSLADSPFPRPAREKKRKQTRALPWILVGMAALVLAGMGWHLAVHEQAASELRAMGFEAGGPSISRQLRTNWRGLFNRNTWQWSDRVRIMGWGASSLDTCAPALRRFKPRGVLLGFSSKLTDVSALKEFAGLERLDFYECPQVADVGVIGEFKVLKELTFHNAPALTTLGIIHAAKLRSLHITSCASLTDLEALRTMSSLRSLYLVGCGALGDAELLRNLSELEELDLSGCANLTGTRALHGLKKLKTVRLRGCRKLGTDDIVALQGALPGAKIEFP
jgi:hypothetical protein